MDHYQRSLHNLFTTPFLDRAEDRRRDVPWLAARQKDPGTRFTLIRQLKHYCHEHQGKVELVASPEVVPGGEAVKSNWQLVQDLMVALGNHHMDRHSYVVAIGGGGVLDMVGFVAALVHRGLRLVRMPTTVLAQNDAGVGVKNGMNEQA